MGIATTFSSTSTGSIVEKFSFTLREEVPDQEPDPAAIVVPVERFALVNIANPPLARTANSLATAELKSASVESAKRNTPLWLAGMLARLPAAKL